LLADKQYMNVLLGDLLQSKMLSAAVPKLVSMATESIAAGMDVSLEEVFGIASFYSQFALNPKGEVSIGVCLGTACYVKGSGQIIERISQQLGVEAGSTSADGKYSLEATRCIGACGLAPVFTVNGEVYGRISKMSEVDDIIAKYN